MRAPASLFALPVLLLPLYGSATALPQEASGPAPQETRTITMLADLRDVARPLIIFAPSPDVAAFREQMAVLELNGPSMKSAESELRERKVVLLPIFETGGNKFLGNAVTRLVSGKTAAEMRERFGVRSGEFKVVLLGLDGGEKKTSERPIDLQTLNATIDAMPMRQRELRGKLPGR
jgi:hypothetical protein